MRKSAAAALCAAVTVGVGVPGAAAASVQQNQGGRPPHTVVCYQEAPGTGCRGPVFVSSGQRLDMILADGSRTPYWSAREECDASGGRLDHYIVRTKRHGHIWRWICRNVDF